MPIETIIFDMDGVLVESEAYWKQARQDFAHELGQDWTTAFQNEAMGRSTVGWAQVMQNRLGITLPLDDIISDIKRRVMEKYEKRVPVRPGAAEAVQLAAQHFRVGLASGSPTDIIKTVLHLTGFDQLFEVMIYGDEIPRGKPAPDIYHEALRQLDMPAETALGIEDSASGIRSVKAAGMYVIAAPSPGFTLPNDILEMADAKIDSLEAFSLELVTAIGNEA